MSAPRATLGQLRALIEAAQWAGMSAAQLAAQMVGVTGATDPEELTPKGWADLMNRFVASGFRHPAFPMVTPAQLAALDEARRSIGLDGRAFVATVRRVGGVRGRRQLDGPGFLAVWGTLARAGAPVPVPGHGFMRRGLVRAVHEAAYQQGFNARMLVDVLAQVGGVLRASQLDELAFVRLVVLFQAQGFVRPAPPPRVPAALDAAIGSMLGLGGGLATLTRAGAAEVIDRFMVPRLNDRRAAKSAEAGQ